ncbi:uncharacterized protein BKA78DRAFT_360273, partial [Phyllosticta capitalensis]|uniref:uncharacterized protein n=1 Tax=Phyllosticta capitalensis TaxID=121624 RepID=UPI0031305366
LIARPARDLDLGGRASDRRYDTTIRSITRCTYDLPTYLPAAGWLRTSNHKTTTKYAMAPSTPFPNDSSSSSASLSKDGDADDSSSSSVHKDADADADAANANANINSPDAAAAAKVEKEEEKQNPTTASSSSFPPSPPSRPPSPSRSTIRAVNVIVHPHDQQWVKMIVFFDQSGEVSVYRREKDGEVAYALYLPDERRWVG